MIRRCDDETIEDEMIRRCDDEMIRRCEDEMIRRCDDEMIRRCDDEVMKIPLQFIEGVSSEARRGSLNENKKSEEKIVEAENLPPEENKDNEEWEQLTLF
jgi:hypothetical protein